MSARLRIVYRATRPSSDFLSPIGDIITNSLRSSGKGLDITSPYVFVGLLQIRRDDIGAAWLCHYRKSFSDIDLALYKGLEILIPGEQL